MTDHHKDRRLIKSPWAKTITWPRTVWHEITCVSW
uniref:Uncharacterized protein n=1 Tax=Anguilla anguilla TaxID=7936 RepID=A0A0E9QGP5_ANGAN